MATWKEIVYMVLDEVKINSDDSYFEEDHIIFLASKYRSLLLSLRYGDIRKDVSISNYQTICVDLEDTLGKTGHPCDRSYLRTVLKIPNIISIGAPRVHSADFFTGDIDIISFDRFLYTGYNKFLKNVIYSTLAPDMHLYIKSANPQYRHLEKVRITAIFSDPVEAFELRCDLGEDSECDIMETDFPLESKLIPLLILIIVKELLGAAYRPQDNRNNANDDLSNLANYLMNITNRNFNRLLRGDDDGGDES